jgi:flavin-dependent dehydrogenase
MVALFLLSLGTDGATMLGIGAAAFFINVLLFGGLAYAIRS